MRRRMVRPGHVLVDSMMKSFAYLAAASALALSGIATPALAAKGGNGNGKGNGGSAPAPSPAPAPAPAPTPTLAGCGYTAGVVVQSTFYIGCSGFFAGNANSGATQAVQSSAVTSLGGDFDGSWLAKIDSSQSSGGLIEFGRTLYGETIIGAHFGNIFNPENLTLGGQGNDNNVTVFWKFDFGTTGANGIQLLNTRGFSNAALYDTGLNIGAVPEPQAWALFTLGFGILGAAMRGRRKQRVAIV